MQKSLYINADKCTGCLQCEMACCYENYGIFNPAKSRIKVFDFHHTGRKVPYTCTQCDEAWCLHACPVEAITIDAATGAKVVLDDVCVGCKVCTIACPFGTDQLRAGHRQGAEVRPVRRRPGLRDGLPDRCHHLRRRRLDRARAHAAVGRQARQPTARVRRTIMAWAGKILRVNLTKGTCTSEPLTWSGRASTSASAAWRPSTSSRRSTPRSIRSRPPTRSSGPPGRSPARWPRPAGATR